MCGMWDCNSMDTNGIGIGGMENQAISFSSILKSNPDPVVGRENWIQATPVVGPGLCDCALPRVSTLDKPD